MATLTPRERVLTTLDHREPDRAPLDFAATTVTGITFLAYEQLRRHLGLEPDPTPRTAHVHQGLCDPREDLVIRYESDFRTVRMKRSPRGVRAREMSDDSFYDGDTIFWKRALHGYYPASTPLAECTIADLDRVQWPDPRDPRRAEGLREEARTLYEGTDYAIVADIMCRGPFEQAAKLQGYERFLTNLALAPKLAAALLDKITDAIIGLWEVYLDAVGDYVQVVCQGDDVGLQRGLFISPTMYRRLIKPCHHRIYDFIHSRTNARVFMHSCGSIYDVIPDLIEVGVNILNPVQYGAARMDLARLKREFGDALCFWGGGIDVQQVAPTASHDEIEAEVKRNLEIMAPGGGYVFALTHNLQPDVTPDRADAIYMSALRNRRYRIAA